MAEAKSKALGAAEAAKDLAVAEASQAQVEGVSARHKQRAITFYDREEVPYGEALYGERELNGLWREARAGRRWGRGWGAPGSGPGAPHPQTQWQSVRSKPHL